jgi:hypothetical protein
MKLCTAFTCHRCGVARSFCEYGNEPSGCTHHEEFLDQLRDYKLLSSSVLLTARRNTTNAMRLAVCKAVLVQEADL